VTTEDATAPTAVETSLEDDRRLAEQLQDRLRREQQTAAAIRDYLLNRPG
jgi:hypothetical protein